MNMWTKAVLLTLVLSTLSSFSVMAQQSSSSNFEVNEFFVGPGGSQDLNSASFSARASLGDLAVGNFAGTNYQLYGGFTTTDVPYIELVVNNTLIDMGVLDDLTTGTGTATFSVRTYLADGYSVHAAGDLPTTVGGGTIDGITTPSASDQGTEQFGFNLVANSATADYGIFGANLSQFPDANFGFGSVTNDYDDDGLFKYSTTDSIAGASTSSGRTDYTASFIMNVAPFTEAGLYETSMTFVATSTF